MDRNVSDFWRQFQSGVEVVVAGSSPDKLLGVRDGFRRYLQGGLKHPINAAVVSQPVDEEGAGLWMSDESTLDAARRSARALEEDLRGRFHFFVGTEGGLHSLEIDGEVHSFVRCWTVIRGLPGEAWGASGSLEIPLRLLEGGPLGGPGGRSSAVAGTRRRGGLISSLTGGLESRRSAVGLSTLHALSTLFYGTLETRA